MAQGILEIHGKIMKELVTYKMVRYFTCKNYNGWGAFKKLVQILACLELQRGQEISIKKRKGKPNKKNRRMVGVKSAVTIYVRTITKLDAIQETKKTDVACRWYY